MERLAVQRQVAAVAAPDERRLVSSKLPVPGGTCCKINALRNERKAESRWEPLVMDLQVANDRWVVSLLLRPKHATTAKGAKRKLRAIF